MIDIQIYAYTQRNVYCIQVNIIYFKYIISLYIRKYIMNSSQALNLIEYILNFSKCSFLVKNIKPYKGKKKRPRKEKIFYFVCNQMFNTKSL